LKPGGHCSRRIARRVPGRSWVAFCGLLVAGSLLARWAPEVDLDWQPALLMSEPWRAFSAAFVHWSPLHLTLNLLAATVVAGFGWAARLPGRATVAFVLAWPLTQLGLLIQPALAHYGGLSGVLHAGVAVGTVWLMATGQGRQRHIGAAVFVGLLIKLALEEPWGPPLRSGGGWDIAIAPLAHSTGALAGILVAGLALSGRVRPSRR
jgi:rhomboid family GlyGly-CTERM serine protease